MSLARISVRRPITVIMRILSLVLLGAICMTRLPVDLLPKVTLPTVVAVIQWPNVAAEEIEAQVTRPVEQAVSSVPNMSEVSSNTNEGVSTVRVQFRWGTDVGQGAIDVLQNVERARRNFPADPTLQSPTVFRFDPSQLPILILGVSGEPDPIKLRTLMDNQVTPILESAKGVASAIVTGGQQRAIMVDVDPDKMRARNVSLSQIVRRLREENQNLPAGIAREGGREYTLRSLGWFDSPLDIKRVPLGESGVYVQDVATVRDAHPERRIYTDLNGVPAVGVVLVKQSDANTVDTAHHVFQKIEQVKKLYPQLEFKVAYDQSQFIENSLANLYHHAILGATLAILILLFFLRNVMSTLVVALSIPISIVSSFTLLYMCGFTLNTMSLAGLALATGLIVDDAVVVLENIFRHMERDGLPPAEAAVTGTNEIMGAAISSTITIMLVFLPLLLIEGRSGQMFFQFALVVIFSLAISLLDAMTVVPMLASRMASGSHETSGFLKPLFDTWGRWQHGFEEQYSAALRWALEHRPRVIISSVAITCASFLLVPLIGTELMPATDSGDFTVTVRMPIGTALATTRTTMQRVEKTIREIQDVDTVFVATGTTLSLRGTTTNASSFMGSATIKLKDERKKTTLDVIRQLRRELASVPGARIQIQPYDLVSNLMAGGNQNLQVDIFGPDLSTLSRLAQDAIGRLRGIEGLQNLDTNWQDASPEVQWRVDRAKMMQLGLNFEDVANSLNTATNGSLAGYYQEGGYQYPIRVQFPEDKRSTVPQLSALPIVADGSARFITLGQVATPTYEVGPNQITRLNRQRYISVSGLPEGKTAGEMETAVRDALKGFELPTGYYWDFGQNQKDRAKEFAGLALAVVLAVGLIYMLLASQFESLVHPFTVLTSVPLASCGVILALFLSGHAFGLTAFVGLLMLVGIVVKNGILLVDYTNLLRSQGHGARAGAAAGRSDAPASHLDDGRRGRARHAAHRHRDRPWRRDPGAARDGGGGRPDGVHAAHAAGGTGHLYLPGRLLHARNRLVEGLSGGWVGQMMEGELTSQAERLEEIIKALLRRLFVFDPSDPGSELTVTQLRVLTILRQSSQNLTGLSHEMGCTVSAVTQIADRLERAGLVERVTDRDRRCKQLQLTEAGVRVVRKRRDKRVQRATEALAQLSPQERESVLRALDVLMVAAEALPFGVPAEANL